MENNTLTPEKELELINAYARSPLTQEQIYTFSVTLCDNEVDRDFECFSVDALTKLQKLFVGKTGISDHSMRSSDQAARIYHCYIEKSPVKKTSTGEQYTALKAKAYMVKTESNQSLIAEIDGGIKKEVSVGCAMNKITCSICGKNMKNHSCEHMRGKTYKGKLCYGILSEPTDAYEWSFVAVPAQRNAGVTKSFTKKEEPNLNAVEIIKSMSEDTLITAKQAEELCEYIAHLEALAKEAECYKGHLIEDISRYSLIIMPGVNSKQFTEGCKAMDVSSLKKFRDDLEKQARQTLPPVTQIKTNVTQKSKNNNDFII